MLQYVTDDKAHDQFIAMKTRYFPTEIFHLGGWNLLENRRD